MPNDIEILKTQIDQLTKAIELLTKANSELREEVRRLKGQNSKNSSKPPSHNYKANKPTGKPGGGQVGHKGFQRKRLNSEFIQTCSLDCCPHCGSHGLEEVGNLQPHQILELVDSGIVIGDYVRLRYRCTDCRRKVSTPLPKGFSRSPYGPRFQAMIVTLTSELHLSKAQVTKLVKSLYQVHLSDGTVCSIEARVAAALHPVYDELLESGLASKDVKYIDETSWREQYRTQYAWVFATKDTVVFEILEGRSRKHRHLFLGVDFSAPCVTDRYCVYSDFLDNHQHCLAHILRNFHAFSESSGIPGIVGKALEKQLKAVFAVWHSFKAGRIDRKTLLSRMGYRRRQLYDWLMDGIYSFDNKRLHGFCSHLIQDFGKMWTFLRIDGMEPTNNLAERCLRPLVLWRKKSLGTKSARGSRFVSIMSSLTQTLRLRCGSLLDFVHQSLSNPDVVLPLPTS